MFGEMEFQDMPKICHGLESYGEEVSERSNSIDGNCRYIFSIQSEDQRNEAADFGFIIEKGDSLTDLGPTPDPATYQLQDLGQVL